MGYPVNRGGTSALDALKFLLVLSSDHITGATGKSPTVTILKTGAAAFTTPAGAVSEVGSGWYQVAGNSTDLDMLGPLLLHATATACDPRDDTFSVVNYNPSNVQPLAPPTSASFGTTTARQIINGSFDLIGVKSPAETIDGASEQDAFRRLNNMIALWATQPLTMLAVVREEFALVANQGEYTIGPSGDFDTVRPIYVTGVNLLMVTTSSDFEIPLGVLSDAAYQSLPLKEQTSTQPSQYSYHPTQPLASIFLWPTPTISTNSLVVYSQQAIQGFGALSTQYTFAPGYAEAIEYNLALRLAAPYGRPVPAEVSRFAAQSLGWLKTANTILVDAWMDPALTDHSGGIYDIFSDTIRGQ